MATRRQTPAGPVATVAVQSEEVEGILEDSFAVSLPSPCTSGQEGERTQVDGQTASNELECGLAGISQGRLARLLASFHALNQIFGRLETSSIHPIHMCPLAQGGQKQLPKCISRPICSALVSVHGGLGRRSTRIPCAACPFQLIVSGCMSRQNCVSGYSSASGDSSVCPPPRRGGVRARNVSLLPHEQRPARTLRAA